MRPAIASGRMRDHVLETLRHRFSVEMRFSAGG
jgi:hypothetical protein